jgi:mRNA interferase MazF
VARFVKGSVVVVPFPFSDLTQAKRRPALVLAELPGDDLILCQITSQHVRDAYAVTLEQADFQIGGLRQTGHIRPNRLFPRMRGSFSTALANSTQTRCTRRSTRSLRCCVHDRPTCCMECSMTRQFRRLWPTSHEASRASLAASASVADGQEPDEWVASRAASRHSRGVVGRNGKSMPDTLRHHGSVPYGRRITVDSPGCPPRG